MAYLKIKQISGVNFKPASTHKFIGLLNIAFIKFGMKLCKHKKENNDFAKPCWNVTTHQAGISKDFDITKAPNIRVTENCYIWNSNKKYCWRIDSQALENIPLHWSTSNVWAFSWTSMLAPTELQRRYNQTPVHIKPLLWYSDCGAVSLRWLMGTFLPSRLWIDFSNDECCADYKKPKCKIRNVEIKINLK